jgi:uncharacterized protein YeaO (DUF488 family)
MGEIQIRRVYDAVSDAGDGGAGGKGGQTFLVDRVWPRGVRKSDLRIDGWLREAAPSTALRQWFGHRPERFAEFRDRYRAELDADPQAVRPLLEAVRKGRVTLLYSARDPEHNQAVVLRDYLNDRLAKSS